MEQEQDKFKLVLTGVFIFFILVGLIAFSTYRSSNTANTNVVVSIWGTVDKTAFDNFVTKYKQEKNLQFQLTYTYKSIDTIDSQLVEAIATGKAPDAILIPHTLEKRYLDKVYMITSVPIRDYIDTYIQEAELYIQPSGIFAMPFFVDPLVMYWNKDMFASASIALPPSKWTEFPALAGKLSKSDNNANIIKSVASLGEFKNVNNAKALLSTLMMQAGSPIVSLQNGLYTSTLDYKSSTNILPPTVSALQFFTDYSNPKKTVYSWNRSLPSSKLSFLSEDLAIYFGFASEFNDIRGKNSNLNFDVVTMPQTLDAQTRTTYGDLYGFSILKSSQNPTATFNMISLLTGTESISYLVQVMDVAPARRDIISLGSQNPIKSVFFNSALISKAWIDPDSRKTDKIFQDMVENVTTGRTGVQESVSNASLELNSLLQ
jgi:ABC-type glycerol-3-phosphate transport system substrate-binding protein